MFFRTILSLQNFLQDIFFNCQSTTIQYFGWLSPDFSGKSFYRLTVPIFKLVGVLGVEPRTSSLSGTRSNQLSYTPFFPLKVAFAAV